MKLNLRDRARTIIAGILVILLAEANAQTANARFNQQLADSLGADPQGMKMYILVILKTGTVKAKDKQTADSLFMGHFQNIIRLSEMGKLVLSGPILKNDMRYEGIFILNVSRLEDAEALLATDPAIKAKTIDAELFQWYGSAALPLYLQYHEAVKKSDFKL